MVNKDTLMVDYGLDVRETEFVREYMNEVEEVNAFMLPFVIVNIRAALSALDAAFDTTCTLEDVKEWYKYVPTKTGKYLLDSVRFFGIRTL